MKRDNRAFALSRRYRMAPLVVVSPRERPSLREQGRWMLEVAWDGHRILGARVGDHVRLVSADQREWSDAFPGVALALRRLAAREVVLEGFLCALDAKGRPSFELLRERARTRTSAIFAVWDLLHVDGRDLRALPLVERRARLAEVIAGAGDALTMSEQVEGDLDAVLEATAQHGFPGVFARPEDGPYPSYDDAPWLVLPHGDAVPSWARSLSPPPVVTNEAKVLFPRDGLTKKDVVGYYESIADVLLPHLRERPTIAQRWPDGIDEFTWYQHRVPPNAPDYLPGVWIEGNRRILLPDRNALLWMVNQAALTLHGWASRVGSLGEPDWVVLDLDPGEKTRWEDVIEVATAIRKLLELLELPSVPKTSGQRGLHVLIPIARGHTAAQANELARGLATMITRLMPDRVTVETQVEKRHGRLYLDHLQNFVGKSLVLAYSLRARDRATVSAPLDWSEVVPKLDPQSFNLRTMRARVDSKGDLAASLLRSDTRLEPALSRLAR